MYHAATRSCLSISGCLSGCVLVIILAAVHCKQLKHLFYVSAPLYPSCSYTPRQHSVCKIVYQAATCSRLSGSGCLSGCVLVNIFATVHCKYPTSFLCVSPLFASSSYVPRRHSTGEITYQSRHLCVFIDLCFLVLDGIVFLFDWCFMLPAHELQWWHLKYEANKM